MQPTRHALAALLLEQNQVSEAEQALRKDLEIHPRNVWALHGLEECLRLTSREHTEEHVGIVRELGDSQSAADVEVKAACACRLSAF